MTKKSLIKNLADLRRAGWIVLERRRSTKDGGLGNTLEDRLNIHENNVPLVDYGDFELKTHRNSSNSLISLFRFEPPPRSRTEATIPRLIRNYSWGIDGHGADERSLRVDMDAAKHSERGFIVTINSEEKRIEMHFDASKVHRGRYVTWSAEVETQTGLGDLSPMPYWTFSDLEMKIRQKIRNMMFVTMETSLDGRVEKMRIIKAQLLLGARLSRFLEALRSVTLQIELSARTHHNHGTAFRTWERNFPQLYARSEELLT